MPYFFRFCASRVCHIFADCASTVYHVFADFVPVECAIFWQIVPVQPAIFLQILPVECAIFLQIVPVECAIFLQIVPVRCTIFLLQLDSQSFPKLLASSVLFLSLLELNLQETHLSVKVCKARLINLQLLSNFVNILTQGIVIHRTFLLLTGIKFSLLPYFHCFFSVQHLSILGSQFPSCSC